MRDRLTGYGFPQMLDASNFRLVYCHAVIYTPELHFRTNRVLTYLLGKHSERLNADPVTLPIPSNAPPEIPRVLLQSGDARLKLQASPARLDVLQEAEAISPEGLKQFVEFALSVFIGYLEAMPCEARRVACVVRRFVPDENGAKNLAAHFCKEQWLADPLNRPSDFEIHAAKQFQFGGWLAIDSWFRCRTQKVKFGEAPFVPGIMIEQDFNSAVVEHETARPFTVEEIRRFFENAPKELDVVVNRYFPPDKGNHV